MAYAKILNKKTIDRNPPRRATINGREVTGELPADYLATLGYLPFDETPVPSEEPTEGKHWEPRYAEAEGRVVQSWTQVDDPAPVPKTYSKYKLVLALQKEEVWDRVKAWLEATPGAYDLYLAAEDISGDEELLSSGIEAAKVAFGWDDAKVAEILASAEI